MLNDKDKRFRSRFIEVTEDELKIIETKEFQRLRNIKQLATTFLVYPGAEHTRFGHSLGVMNLATRAFDSAINNYKELNGQELFDLPTKNTYRQALRLIALLHDVGHAPFSHAFGLFAKGLKHEDFTKAIIERPPIRNLIEQIGDNKEFEGCVHKITPELLWTIYGETDDAKLFKFPNYDFQQFNFIKAFMDSDIDCDKMDYLLRDSYYCGVNYGKFDLERVIGSLSVYKDKETLRLALQKSGLQAFEELILARYFMFVQVYFHKSRRYLDHLLAESLKTVFKDHKFKLSEVERYLKEDDTTVWGKIRKASKNCGAASDFIGRKMFTCVYESESFETNPNTKLINGIEKTLIKKGIPQEDYFIDIAEKQTLVSDFEEESGKGIAVINKSGKREKLNLISLILGGMKPIAINRVYINKKHTNVINEIKDIYN